MGSSPGGRGEAGVEDRVGFKRGGGVGVGWGVGGVGGGVGGGGGGGLGDSGLSVVSVVGVGEVDSSARVEVHRQSRWGVGEVGVVRCRSVTSVRALALGGEGCRAPEDRAMSTMPSWEMVEYGSPMG